MKTSLAGLMFTLMVGMMSDSTARSDSTKTTLVFISSFAAGAEGAIGAFHIDPVAGTLTPAHRTSGVEHPFFLALSPDRRFLYSIQARQFGGTESEHVAAYAISGAGELTLLNRQSSRGTASCYLDVDASGKTLLVANYSSGSVAALPVRKDGSLGEPTAFIQHQGSSVNPERQTGPHAHCIVVSPDNRHAFSADLGMDQIVSYQLDAAKANLTPSRQPFVRTAPGMGPRHLTFRPNGRHVYVINEIGNSVTLFDYEPGTGGLIERQTLSSLPKDFKGKSACADLKITPDGRFLYGTNRGHDSIAAYRLADDGRLSLIGIHPSLGKGPQNLAIVDGGRLLLCANLPGNNVALFRIDPQTGGLTSVGQPVPVTSPSCIMSVK